MLEAQTQLEEREENQKAVSSGNVIKDITILFTFITMSHFLVDIQNCSHFWGSNSFAGYYQ